MMNAQQFILSLQNLDIRLATNNDKLTIDAPIGTLNPELTAKIIDHKHSLISYLNSIHLINAKPSKAKPLVSGINCHRFEQDTLGSGAGIGSCNLGHQPAYPELPLYPFAKRRCEFIDLNKEITSHDI